MTSPRTNARLESKTLIPNVALRQQIDEFCKANGYSPPRPYYPPQRAPRQMTPDGVNDPCPHIPGWVLASLFLGIWLFAWAAGSTILSPPPLSPNGTLIRTTKIIIIIIIIIIIFETTLDCTLSYSLFITLPLVG
jgi:hypothetical protein